MERLHDSDLRLLLSLLDHAIMPEGPEQRERIKSIVEHERQEREFPYESRLDAYYSGRDGVIRI
jgi:hypothetical protein